MVSFTNRKYKTTFVEEKQRICVHLHIITLVSIEFLPIQGAVSNVIFRPC